MGGVSAPIPLLTNKPNTEVYMAKESLPLTNQSTQSRRPGKKYYLRCSIEGCSRLFYGRTWCKLHYQRWRATGDPLGKIPRSPLPISRFWEYVDRTPGFGPNGDCWQWTGGVRFPGGYGRLYMFGRTYAAHRLVWRLTYGKDAEGMVLHACDMPLCVNPEHLREGDAAENAQDRVNRDRQLKGSRHWKAKLTEDAVATIRQRLAGGEKGAVIGRDFGVSRTVISSIRRNQTWRHVEI